MTLRPIKLAFLVEPSDINALHTAISVNTFLWGGMHNPIVPAFQRMPKNWARHTLSGTKKADVVRGYLDAYDPDFVVPLGNCAQHEWNLANRNIIKVEEILPKLDEDFAPGYGIGLFEVLNQCYKEEFKFKRTEQLNIIFPELPKKYMLFLQSVFGTLPKEVDDIIKNQFDTKLDIKRPKISIQQFYKYLAQDYLFPRRMTMWKIKPERQNSFNNGQCLFVMDATKSLDIIDYWNLRAIGWNVIPVPIQIIDDQGLKTLAEMFIEENYWPYRGNSNIYHNTTILKSRNVSEHKATHFAQSLNLKKPEKEGNPKHFLQFWYPRIWDNWARDKDGVVSCNLSVDTQEHDFNDLPDGYISLRTVDPKLMFKRSFTGMPRFANEISMRFYGNERDPLAEVIPEGGPDLASSFGAIGWNEWRVGGKGLVYLSHYSNSNIRLKLPLAEPVFNSWMKSQTWDVTLSPTGRIAKQMLKQVGGVWGISFLAKPRLIHLLERMAEGKTLNKQVVLGEMQRIANEQKFSADPGYFIKMLTERDIIRLGLEVQCPTCQQYSWHAINNLDYSISCEKCLQEFTLPTHSPGELKWAYRAHGPFSLPKKAYGVYAVLLTLRFFSKVLEGATSPLLSFTAKHSNKNLEADLGIFYQKMIYGREKRELIFAECKTYNLFENIDIDRMKTLAKSFPGAVIVFSTLRNHLTEKEKKLIRPLANNGRRYWRDNKSYNPILVLTGTELFSGRSINEAWKNKGGRHNEFASTHHYIADLLPLCDLTQQLYLGMSSWHEWQKSRWDRRRLTLEKRKGTN